MTFSHLLRWIRRHRLRGTLWWLQPVQALPDTLDGASINCPTQCAVGEVPVEPGPLHDLRDGLIAFVVLEG